MTFELSLTTWKLGFSTDLGAAQRLRTIEARDRTALLREIQGAARALGLSARCLVVACYEAGRDGFWLHRFLESQEFTCYVVDPASIETSRRGKTAKSDRIDVGKLLTMLIRYQAGEPNVWSVVHVPSVADEDARHLHRELRALKQERTRGTNRIKGLLINHGADRAPRDRGADGVGAGARGLRLAALREPPPARGPLGHDPRALPERGGGRDRGISKAGSRLVRMVLVELAWRWLRLQPKSALTRWYNRRFARGGARQRKIGIVALARKLLIALWRYLEGGVVPEGARLKAV